MTRFPAMLGVIKTLEQSPDTTVAEAEKWPVSSGGDDQTDTSAPANDPKPMINVQLWDSYSTEDRAAALGYLKSSTRSLLGSFCIAARRSAC